MAWTPQDWASVITAGIAFVALIGAIWQVKVSRTSQREATASQLYANYLALAVANPMLAGGYVSAPPNGDVNEEFERYEWFVSLMLHAFEQILDLTSGDLVWQQAISDQIKYHEEYLSSPRFVSSHYSASLCALFPRAQETRKIGDSPPENGEQTPHSPVRTPPKVR